MQSRRFADRGGTESEVHLLVSTPQILTLQPAASNQLRPFRTWLALDSQTARRKLWPLPPGWKDATADDLATFLRLYFEVRWTWLEEAKAPR